jgi:hypothetical protein
LIAFIEWCEKRVVEYAASQLAIATVGATASKASNMPAILGDVGQAFAGFVANLAPALGPAAIPTATGLAVATQAQATALAGLATGAWEIPTTQPYNLHPGEMVMPETFASGLRSALSGGTPGGGTAGGDVHVHMEGSTVIGTQAWLNSMIPQLQRALSGYQALNPSTA